MSNLALAQPAININPDDVLREYGLDSIGQTTTVIQRGEETVAIRPVENISLTESLEPPTLESVIEESLAPNTPAPVEVTAEVSNVEAEAPQTENIVPTTSTSEDYCSFRT